MGRRQRDVSALTASWVASSALYRAPLPIGVDDPELAIECEQATLGVEHSVRWGERFEDEMCMAFVLVGAAAR